MKIQSKTTKTVLISALLSSIIAMFLHMTSIAQDQTQQDREVVVLLDCSKSMEDVDSRYLAFDFVKGLAAALPRNCKMGIVAYNNEIPANREQQYRHRESFKRPSIQAVWKCWCRHGGSGGIFSE